MGSAWSNLVRKANGGNVFELNRHAADHGDADGGRISEAEIGHLDMPVLDDAKEIPDLPAKTVRAPGGSEEHRPGYERDHEGPLLSEAFINQLALRIVNILNEAQSAKSPVGGNRLVPAEDAGTAETAVAAMAPAPTQPEDDIASPGATVVEQSTFVSHIAPGATVNGGVHDYGDGAVSVGGKFTPEKLTCGDLTILAGASIRGDISASGLVKIYGNVEESDILAQGIEIYDSAKVNGGSLKSETIGIQVGAHISGAITTRTMRNRPE